MVLVDQGAPAPGHAIDVASEAEGIFHTSDKTLTIRAQNPGLHTYVVVLADGTNARLGEAEGRTTVSVDPPGVSLDVSPTSLSCPNGVLVTATTMGFGLPDATTTVARLDATGVTVVPPLGATTSTTPETVLGATTTTSTTSTTVAGPTTTTTAGPTTTTTPPPPTMITWFLDRVPTSGPATATDFGTVTSAGLGLCVTGLVAGHHAVWAVTVDTTGTPVVPPIESLTAFTTGQ